MKKWHALLTSVILFSLSSLIYADVRANSFMFTLGGGRFFFDPNRNLDDANSPFVALGYNIYKNWGVEASYMNFHTKNSPDTTGQSTNGTLVSFNGIYHFAPENTFQPYAIAGVGVLGLSHNGSNAHNAANVKRDYVGLDKRDR